MMRKPTTKRLIGGLTALLVAALVAVPVAQARLAVDAKHASLMNPVHFRDQTRPAAPGEARPGLDGRHASLLNPVHFRDQAQNATPVGADSKTVQMHRHLAQLKLPASEPNTVVSRGQFDWADAGIGAAAGLGLVLLAGAGVLVTRRRLVSV
jgi:hypothetical protein